MRITPAQLLVRHLRYHRSDILPSAPSFVTTSLTSVSESLEDPAAEVTNSVKKSKSKAKPKSPVKPAPEVSDVARLEPDEDAFKYLATVLGRLVSSDIRRGYQAPLVQLEPGPGFLTHHLLTENPQLTIHGVYSDDISKQPNESQTWLGEKFPDRFSASSDSNIWGTFLQQESGDSVVSIENIFHGEEETTRREERRQRKSAAASDVNGADTEEELPASAPPRKVLLSTVRNYSAGRLIDRFIDAALEPEGTTLGRYVPHSLFYFIMPMAYAPLEMSRVYDHLPKIESKEDAGNLVIPTANRFKANTKVPFKTRLLLMSCFYDVSAHAAICPNLFHDFTGYVTKKAAGPYLLVRFQAKEGKVPLARRRGFGVFINMLGGAMSQRVIPTAEEVVPHVGPVLIMEGGFTMAELVKDLSVDRVLKLFEFLCESPLYPDSVLGMIESDRMNSDEWTKRALKIKGAYTRAVYTGF